jgi:major membrane immunogen (membrane-anchored lipoprotein)
MIRFIDNMEEKWYDSSKGGYVMRKFLYCLLLVLVFVLVGCSSDDVPTEVPEVERNSDVDEAEKDEEISMRDGAIEADFIEINGDRVEEGTKITLTATIETIEGTEMFDKMLVFQDEPDGNSVYVIEDFTGDLDSLSEGDTVTIWGLYNGKEDNTSIPVIGAFEYEIAAHNSEVNHNISRINEIENMVSERFSEGLYRNAKINRITVNDNLGTDVEGDYILLVNFIFDIKNTRETGNEMMRMYSDDLVAYIGNNDSIDIVEAAIFWEDEYNGRTVKYAYEHNEDGFYITDIMGE